MENNYSTWYQALEKPFFAPEPWVFGAAWSVVYPLMLTAFVYFLYLYFFKNKFSRKIFYIFILNWIANLAFTPISFLQNNILASLDILVVLISLLYLQFYFYKENKVMFILLLPYVLWGSFATVLMITMTYLNF